MGSKFLDIKDIEAPGLSLARDVDARDFPGGRFEDGEVVAGRLTADLRPGPRGGEFRGRLEVELRVPCVRCLEPFSLPLAFDFQLILVQEPVDPAAGDAAAWDDEEASRWFHAPEGIVDLGALVAEQVYLNLPLKPVCTPGCRGLCPTCGADRNRLECGCPERSVDPRLAPLADWRGSGRRP